MRKRLSKWDPTWGWDNQIYYLGGYVNDENFWMSNPSIYSNNKKIPFSAPKNTILCAGNFIDNLYFGSLSHDLVESDKYVDQSIFVCDKNWNLKAQFRPSNIIKKPNKYLSIKKYAGQLAIPFRDPVSINQGNKIAISTGGFRAGVPGNVCELTFEKNTFEISRETIIDEDMFVFDEIERCTFWNEYMFFSGRIKSNTLINKIQVAKLNRNGFYSYFGEVRNSENRYGPNVNSSLQMLFWYTKIFDINNPFTQNLFYENAEWIIKEKLINRIIISLKINTDLRVNKKRFSPQNLYKYITSKIKKIINWKT